MATIANILKVMVSGSAAGFTATMNQSKKALAGFTSTFSSTSAKIGAIGAALGAGAAVYGLKRITAAAMESIDATAKLADRLAITTEQLVGLEHGAGLAGISSELLAGSLQKMLVNLSQAAEGTGPAADALKQMGLDAKTLASGSTDAAFKRIADGLKGMDNPAQRAAASVAIFGKAGQGLGNLLMSGSEGIAAAQAEAEKLGLTFSRVDAAQVEAANDAMSRLQAVVTGVGNKLAIGLAPYIEAAAAKFTALATQGGGIGPKIGGAIEWVASAVATASDYLQLFKAGFKLLQSGATFAIFGVIKAVDWLGDGLVKLLNLIPGVSLTWGEEMGALADGMLDEARRLGDEAGQAFDSFSRGDSARAVAATFENIRRASQQAAEATAASAKDMAGAFEELEDESKNIQKVADALADLEKQLRQAGMTDGQKKLDDLAAMGATPEQLSKAGGIQAQLNAIEAQKKAQEEMGQAAKSMYEATRTDAEKYAAEIERINELLIKGAIDQETAQRAADLAKEELRRAQDKGSTDPADGPRALQVGSGDAAKFVSDIQRRQRGADKGEQLVKQGQQGNKLLSQIAKNTESGGGIAVNVVTI